MKHNGLMELLYHSEQGVVKEAVEHILNWKIKK